MVSAVTTGCGRSRGEAAHFREHPSEPRARCLPAGGNFDPIQSPEDKTGQDHRYSMTVQ